MQNKNYSANAYLQLIWLIILNDKPRLTENAF